MMKNQRRIRPSFRAFIFAAALSGLALINGSAHADNDRGPGALVADYQPIPGQLEFSGRLIVRPVQPAAWKERGLSDVLVDARAAAAHDFINTYNVIEYIPQTDEYIVTVPEGSNENATARTILATGNFQYAEPDWIVYPVECPNDTFFSPYQWQHVNMDSCAAWDIETGQPNISVGICDTGIRTTHEDFQLHRLEGYNAVDRLWESQGGDIGPVHSHGTQTTGCAAANGNNGKGVAGVGWNLSHRMLRVSNSSNGSANMSTLQHAARTAVENGDKVASVSYSGVDTASNLTTASYIKSIGGLLVWAAGNDGRNLTYGNRDNDDIIVVGATDSNDTRASFSAYGQFVDVVAPGVNVVTASSGSDSNYVYASGTSFSTPLTAGLCALIWSADPSLSPDDVENLVKQGADDIGTPGIDSTYGYGRINSHGSLLLVGGGGSNTPPVADLAADPMTGDAPLLVNFDASGSYDLDGSIVDFAWDWDGDGTFDANGTSPTAQHTYVTPDTYEAVVRVTDNEGAFATDSVTIIVNDAGGGGDPESIASDGFESRSFSGGDGSWIDSWYGSGATLRWSRDNPHTGNGHVRFRRNNWMERVVDLTGVSDVRITFWWKTYSFESGDQAEVWVSPDGVNYTQVINFVNGQDDNQYHYAEVDLSGFAMTSNFHVVFNGNMSANSDYWWVDDIDFIGVR